MSFPKKSGFPVSDFPSKHQIPRGLASSLSAPSLPRPDLYGEGEWKVWLLAAGRVNSAPQAPEQSELQRVSNKQSAPVGFFLANTMVFFWAKHMFFWGKTHVFLGKTWALIYFWWVEMGKVMIFLMNLDFGVDEISTNNWDFTGISSNSKRFLFTFQAVGNPRKSGRFFIGEPPHLSSLRFSW